MPVIAIAKLRDLKVHDVADFVTKVFNPTVKPNAIGLASHARDLGEFPQLSTL